MRILLFNPEHDMALAADDERYTPPASARQMASDLALLPRLWAREGDVVAAGDGADVAGGDDVSVLPWGWDPLLVRRLREAGVAEACLPSREELAAYRAFASRETAVALLARLRREWHEAFDGGRLVGESVWCRTEDDVLRAIGRYGGTAVLKAPWSGSGRGIKHWPGPHGREWVVRTLARQGGVEVEPLYAKVADIAMEFWSDGGRVSYEGLSLFETTSGGVYGGNLVADEAVKEALLARRVDVGLLHQVRSHLLELLNGASLPAWYRGPFGIDMMVVDAQGVKLHPLVEINFRMTMGWVALQLQKQLADGETASFRIGRADGRYVASLGVSTLELRTLRQLSTLNSKL